MDFPDDVDGDVLRRIASHSDMTKPRDIDFVVVAPSEESAKSFAALVLMLGYRPSVSQQEEESEEWDIYCTTYMVPTYAGVIAVQKELDNLSRQFDAYCEGWGTMSDPNEEGAKKEE